MAIIHIGSREYWRKSAGYTLQSVRVWVDGQDVGVHGLTYSSERSGAIELALAVLDRAGYDPGVDRSQAHWDSAWRDAGHTLSVDMSWVGKRDDAHRAHGSRSNMLLWRVFRDGEWHDARLGHVPASA